MNGTSSNSSPSPADPSRRDVRAGKIDPLDWIDEAQARRAVSLAVARQLRTRTRRRRTAVAAVSLLALGLACWQFPRLRSAAIPPAASIVVESPPRQVLPDGSILELRDDARVRIEFSDTLRRVVLPSGEAFVSVAKDPRRPFVIVTGSVQVKAVGTAFAVQHGARAIEVVVTEGHVAVDAPGSGDRAAPRSASEPIAMLDPGHQLVIDLASPMSAPQVKTLLPTELAERLAWRVPWLELSHTPLAEVIPHINAHSPTRLALANPSLGRLRLSGRLRADNLETLLELLAEAHGITAESRPGEIVLRGRP